MSKSIFIKLVIICLLIVIIGYSVLGATLYYFLGDFVISEKVELLENSAEEINESLIMFLKNDSNVLLKSFFINMLDSYRQRTDSFVWIINTNGEIVLKDEGFIPETVFKKIKTKDGRLVLPDERQYNEVKSGEASSIIEKGDFYGLFEDTGVMWLTVKKPVIYKNETIAVAILHTPIPEVTKARSAVFKFFLLSALISIFITTILIYFFSKRLVKPLKEINFAAREIAEGDFGKRLSINSKDEIGELANSFNYMLTALENLENMRKDFIANVSHELRTPMTTIKGYIQGVIDDTIPEEKRNEYLEIAVEEADRLNRIVDNLLVLARMESGETKLNFCDFDINELIRRCIIRFERIIVKKEIEIEVNFESEEMYVNANKDSIERVIINLLHNALKFSKQKGKVCINVNKSKGKASIAIIDNGIGIEESEIKYIWDRFYKSDKSRGLDKSGTGLGLSIVKSIINEHKQKITVESNPGERTKFTFTLNMYNG